MADSTSPSIGRMSIADRRKKIANPFPAGIGEYHETHPLGGGGDEPSAAEATVQPTPAPEPVVSAAEVKAPVQSPAPVAEVQQPPTVQQAPIVQSPAPVQQPAPVAEAPPAPIQQPTQQPVAPVQAYVEAQPPAADASLDPQASAPPFTVASRRSDAPRLSELKPVPAVPFGQGLYDKWVTGGIVDYPLGRRYEDYIGLNFDQGYNKSFKRMEARVSPLVEEWLEVVARRINETSRLAGSSKHLNDTRMRNNAVLRTALEKGLKDLVVDGATSEASLRELNGLPPAPEQALFDTFLRDKLRRQQEEFGD